MPAPRDVPISIRLAPDERAVLEAAAKAAGVQLRRYMRTCALAVAASEGHRVRRAAEWTPRVTGR